MPKFRRLVVPGYPHHVTQRGVRRQTTFFDDADYQAYLNLAANLLGEYSIEIWAYCLMPNHIHAVVVPHDKKSMSSYFARLHQQYARRTNLRQEWSGHLWQKRFYSVVLDERHTYAAMRYVELNPVRSGISCRAAHWRWSSARGNLGLVEDPLILRRHTRAIVSDWKGYLAEPDDERVLTTLRRRTATGRPGGDDAFLDELEKRTGRRIRKRRAGRKPEGIGCPVPLDSK